MKKIILTMLLITANSFAASASQTKEPSSWKYTCGGVVLSIQESEGQFFKYIVKKIEGEKLILTRNDKTTNTMIREEIAIDELEGNISDDKEFFELNEKPANGNLYKFKYSNVSENKVTLQKFTLKGLARGQKPLSTSCKLEVTYP